MPNSLLPADQPSAAWNPVIGGARQQAYGPDRELSA